MVTTNDTSHRHPTTAATDLLRSNASKTPARNPRIRSRIPITSARRSQYRWIARTQTNSAERCIAQISPELLRQPDLPNQFGKAWIGTQRIEIEVRLQTHQLPV